MKLICVDDVERVVKYTVSLCKKLPGVDGEYNHSQQKYLDVIIRGLRDALAAKGVEDILEVKSGFLRIRPEKLSCDLYRFLERDPAAVNAYRGKYMSGYPWAALSESGLTFSRYGE